VPICLGEPFVVSAAGRADAEWIRQSVSGEGSKYPRGIPFVLFIQKITNEIPKRVEYKDTEWFGNFERDVKILQNKNNEFKELKTYKGIRKGLADQKRNMTFELLIDQEAYDIAIIECNYLQKYMPEGWKMYAYPGFRPETLGTNYDRKKIGYVYYYRESDNYTQWFPPLDHAYKIYTANRPNYTKLLTDGPKWLTDILNRNYPASCYTERSARGGSRKSRHRKNSRQTKKVRQSKK
jgi:hypothetical protein